MPNTIQKGSEKMQKLPEEHYYLGNGQEIPSPRAVRIGDDETAYATGSGGVNTTKGTFMTQTNTTQNKEELETYRLGEFIFTKNSLGCFTTPEITGYFYEKKREIEFSEEQLIKMGAKQQIDKQELEQWENDFDKYYSDLYYTKQCNSYMNGNTLCNYKYSKVYGIKNFISKLLSQAHQSGIEEGRKAILEEVRSEANKLRINKKSYFFQPRQNEKIDEFNKNLEQFGQKLSILEGETK